MNENNISTVEDKSQESNSDLKETKEEIKDNKKKPKSSIASKFWAYLSVLIFITVLFMTLYAVWTGINLIDRGKRDKALIYQHYSNAIVEITRDEILSGSYNKLDELIESLKNKGDILFACIVKPDGIISYSTNKSLVGVSKDNTDFLNILNKLEGTDGKQKTWLQNYLDLLFLTSLNNPIYRNAIILPDQSKILIYFYLGDTSQVAVIYKGYIALAFTFIFCGFLSSVYLSKIVTKPIKELYNASEKFSQKDLSFRIQIETDDEIGRLAQSFNKMAEELEQSYASLETKVKERTLELEQKKEEVEGKNKEIEKAYDELKAAQVKLVHSEKMSSLGQLVAGVAHELNNPINFIYGNMEHLKNYAHDLKSLIEKYEGFLSALNDEQRQEVEDLKEDIDYEFLLEDLDDLLDSCKEGAERTRQIVLDLRNFSRLDEASLKEVNIHEGIDSTLNILHNKFKNRVEVLKDYADDIPLISCFAGQLNQVFMNLLANAAQSIEGNGEVKVVTRKDDSHVVISFIDNGSGIAPENLSRIFDPFFTTKDVGEGTGLGLSVSYGIIEKHNGTISVESKLGEGTTFTVRIPIKWKRDDFNS